MKFNARAASFIDPYIAELGRDGWAFVAEVESTGELIELRCDALPIVEGMLYGKRVEINEKRVIRQVEDAVESAAFARGLDYRDLQADGVIEGAWDVARSVCEEVERLAK